jgi:hypothetical protein
VRLLDLEPGERGIGLFVVRVGRIRRGTLSNGPRLWQ